MNLKESLDLARLILGMMALLATANFAVAAKSQPEDFTETARTSSALEILAYYEHSQMILMYVELAQRGVTIETPEGLLSKRKAKKLAKEHSARIEALEQVMSERGVRELAGKYDWAIEGECESARAWWPALGQNGMCGHPSIIQDGMDEYRKDKSHIHLNLKVSNNSLHRIVQLSRHANWSTLHPQIQFLARYNVIFCQSLNPGQDHPYRYQNGNSKSVSWLSLLLQSNKPTGRLGEARQSGNRSTAAELAVLARWASIF